MVISSRGGCFIVTSSTALKFHSRNLKTTEKMAHSSNTESKTVHPTVQYQKKQKTCYGFLRNALNDQTNYDGIFSIIIEYSQQGYAKHFDTSVDEDYEGKMRFGDFVKIHDDRFRSVYKCLDINNSLIKIGTHKMHLNLDSWEITHYLDIGIPLSVCKHLDDAYAFYSKVFTLIKPTTGIDIGYCKSGYTSTDLRLKMKFRLQ